MKRLILLLLVSLAACSSPKPPSDLRISFNTYPVTVDPRKSGDFVSSTLICLIYEGLTRCLPDGSAELALAKSVDISPDRTSYTFHLRPAIWSNGEKVTAYDFEASWKKNLDPEFPSLCAYLFYPIKNSEAAFKKEVPLSEIGIKVLDEETLFVELERPTPYFLSLTAFPSFFPVPKKGADDLDSGAIPVTNGPFRIEKMATNSEIRLVKNVTFWNQAETHLDRIQIQIVSDENTALQMFERGELDWLGGAFSPLPPDASESLLKREEFQFSPSAATTFCSFNTSFYPLSHPKMRRALAYAIDRPEIVEKITQTGQQVATRIIPPVLAGGANKTLYPAVDPERAQKLFQEALEELELSHLPRLTLSFRTGQIEKRIAQTLQKQWKSVLGIDVELNQTDFKTHKENLHARNYQLSLSCWIAQFTDPMNILERFKEKDQPKNYPGWENESFVRFLALAENELDLNERLRWIEEAEQLFATEMPLAPIYHWSTPGLLQKRIQDLAIAPSGAILFERCSISNEKK